MSVFLALGASVSFHGLWLALRTEASRRHPEGRAQRVIELELLDEDVAPALRSDATTLNVQETPRASRPVQQHTVPQRPNAKKQPPRPDAKSTGDAPSISGIAAKPDATDKPSGVNALTPRRVVSTLDLSPRRIATAAETRGASMGTVDQAPNEHATRDIERRISAQLSAELTSDAFVPSPFTPHRAPDLQKDPDGTCHYSGATIDATILTDGGVQLNDKTPALVRRDGVAEPPKNPHTQEEQLAPQEVAVRLRYEPRGVEAEKDWFLRETKALRTELSDKAHKREVELAAADLREQLERSWCDASRPLLDRKRTIVQIWHGLASDALGFHGRDIVLEFVKTHAPEDSELAFTTQELDVFNAGCAFASCFLPYGPSHRR